MHIIALEKDSLEFIQNQLQDFAKIFALVNLRSDAPKIASYKLCS